MNSKSLKDAIAAAEADAGSSGSKGGSSAWDASDERVTVVSSNVNTQYAPRIGLQFQRASDGRRRWFDLYFDESNPKAFRMTGIKLKNLGMSDIIDRLDEQFPGDTTAQLEALAHALVGVEFVAEIQKVESNKNAPNATDDPNDGNPDKVYLNYFQVKELISGPSTIASVSAPVAEEGGLGGLMG